MQRPVRVAAGQASYQGGQQGPRAGDYSGLSIDPVNPNKFWAANEYATAPAHRRNWGTWLVGFSLISLNQTFVAQAYGDVLQRPVDPGGLAFWTSALDHGFSRALLALTLASTPEYRVQQVQRLYQAVLGRPVDPWGLDVALRFLASGGFPRVHPDP
jgi:hypothetical protein